MKRFHTIVLGLGAMGSAALYQLSKRGVSALGIDQFDPPHNLGSSHGDTRITRLAIGEGAAYTPLAMRSHQIWRELEAASGADLLTVTGGLVIGSPEGAGFFHGNPNFVRQTIESAQLYGIEHQILDGGAIRRRFPAFSVADDEVGYYEDEAGFVRPERCVGVQLELARANGAEVLPGTRVLGWQTAGDGVEVRTASGAVRADHLIITAGPWVSEMLAASFQPQLRVCRQVLYWFEVADVGPFEPGRFPVYIWDCGRGEVEGIYGFPAIDGPSGGIKIATEQYHTATTPQEMDRNVSPREMQAMYERHVAPHLAGVGPNCLRALVCPYTVTPDSHFVIAPHPEVPQVLVASPCSGHGFKHSAAIGEALSQWVVDGAPQLDLSSFGWPDGFATENA